MESLTGFSQAPPPLLPTNGASPHSPPNPQFFLLDIGSRQVEIFQGRGGFIESRYFDKNFLQIRALFSVFEKGQGGTLEPTALPCLLSTCNFNRP